MRIGFLIAGVGLAALILLGLNYYFGETDQAEPAPQTTVVSPVPESEPPTAAPVGELIEQTPPSPVAVEKPVLVLPPLEESDAFVRQRLTNPAEPGLIPEAWLAREDLLSRLAVVVENANRGELPRRQLSFLAPDGKFQIREIVPGPDRRTLFVDPVSYTRYDRYLDILESVPPATAAGLLTDARPLLEQALTELGSSELLMPQVLSAIDQVLAVPVIRVDIELVQPKVLYEYADPDLEGLSPLQKQVLRMGPDNVTRLQDYLLTLRTALQQP